MKDQHERTVQTVQDAARRLEEIRQLSDDLKDVLRARIIQMRDERDLSPTEITKKLGELHSAHLKLIQQEEIFHAKLGRPQEQDALDYDVLRAEIGRMLDRIRATARNRIAVDQQRKAVVRNFSLRF